MQFFIRLFAPRLASHFVVADLTELLEGFYILFQLLWLFINHDVIIGIEFQF